MRLSAINLVNVRRLIAGVGFLQAALLVADIAASRLKGSFITASLPRIPIPGFFPNQWMLWFVLRNMDPNSNPWVLTIFTVSAVVWVLATVLFLLNANRMWVVLIGVALLGFWYSPWGIWLGVVEIILLAAFKVLQDQVSN